MFKITLTAARINAGLSLEKVAESMGKSKSTIINWEKGRTSMRIAEYEKLCDLYAISPDNIILPNTLLKVESKK